MSAACRKLVRDRIPEIIQSEGRRPLTHVLDEASYRQALLAKLTEEAQEASHATKSQSIPQQRWCHPVAQDQVNPTQYDRNEQPGEQIQP